LRSGGGRDIRIIAATEKGREAEHEKSGAGQPCVETYHQLSKIPVCAETRQNPASPKARSFASRIRNIFDDKEVRQLQLQCNMFCGGSMSHSASALKARRVL
jgi:hypothetical protein